MKYNPTLLYLFAICCTATAVAQSEGVAAAPGNQTNPAQGTVVMASQNQPVSYASITQLNGLLTQLESTSKSTQADLTKLRIEHWKTDGSTKKQTLANVDSIERNLQNALPEIIVQLRNSPTDLSGTFKLYRNLDALYDVLGSVTESAGAFGPKDEFQSLSNDVSAFEGTRKQLAERLSDLAASKEQEIARLRADLRTAQAAIPATPPKKVVVDDTQPEKKPAPKKKPATKKPASTTTPSSSSQTPPAQPKQ